MTPYVGEIRLLPFTFAPQGWLLCDGATLDPANYQVLFAVLGTKYGGNGSSTFQIPNLQSKVVVGAGQLTGGQNYVTGATGGAATVTLTEANLAPHTHTMLAITTNAATASPSNAVLAKTVPLTTYGTDFGMYSTLPSGTTPAQTFDPSAVSYEGGNGAHNNMAPTIVLNYMIAYDGLYPSPQ